MKKIKLKFVRELAKNESEARDKEVKKLKTL